MSVDQVPPDAPAETDQQDSSVSRSWRSPWVIGAFLIWLTTRTALFAAATPWRLPDSGKYLAEKGSVLAFDGRTPGTGWLASWLYSLVASDSARTWLQFAIATACWGTAAWLLSQVAAPGWQRRAALALVLLFSLSLPVLSLDRIIQTESLSLSFVTLWLALWLRLLDRPRISGLIPWWLAMCAAAAIVARPQVVVVVGPLSLAILAWLMIRSKRLSSFSLAPVAVILVAMVWAPIALTNADRYNNWDASRAFFLSWYRNADNDYRAMELAAGRPSCEEFDSDAATTESAGQNFSWDFFLQRYAADCPELRSWHASLPLNYLQRVVQAPAATGRLLIRDAPELFQPWVRGENPRPLGVVQGTLFGIVDQPGLVNTEPQPRIGSWLPGWRVASAYNPKGVSADGLLSILLWALAGAVLCGVAIVRGYRVRRRMWVGGFALSASFMGGVLFAWLGDAWEMDRHALAWTLLLRLLLVLVPLIAFTPNPEREPVEDGSPATARAKLTVVLTLCLTLVAASYAGPAATATPTALPNYGRLPSSGLEADRSRESVADIVFASGERPSVERITDVTPAPESAVPLEARPVTGGALAFRVRLREGLFASGVYLAPKTPARCALVFNGGHAPWQTESGRFIAQALKGRCAVAAVNMPLFDSVTTVDRFGNNLDVATSRGDHTGLRLLESDRANILDLFLLGPLSAADWLRERLPGLPIAVSGFSGGGWVTTVAAALDQRFLHSIAIAGSSYAKELANCHDEYEQCHPELLARFSLEDLYFLSAYSSQPRTRRVAVQVLNVADPCCHAAPVNPDWVTRVNLALQQVGDGVFSYQLANVTPPRHTVPVEADRALTEWLRTLNK